MRIKALVIRILRQFFRDKRTMALMIVAPIIILTMLSLVFNGEEYTPKVGFVNVPEPIQEKLKTNDAEVTVFTDEVDAQLAITDREIDGYIIFNGKVPSIVLEGSDPTVNRSVMVWAQKSLQSLKLQQNTELEVSYVNGSKDMGQFDYFGPVLLGFFAFFFVFLIAGVSFLRERTTGTLERLLSSPLHKWEIVVGYTIGFGLFTMLQATIIAWYAIYILDMMMTGAFGYVLLITLLLSLSALTLGILLSAFANNELQMIQFIPLVVMPQIFFSGMFNLDTITDWLSWIGVVTPLYYAAEALKDVMVRGLGWEAIMLDVLVLTGFSIAFMILNVAALRKYRKI